MKKLQLHILMSLVSVAVFLAGCASTDVQAVYVVAPRVVSNLKDLGAIRVETEIHLSGNAVESRDGYSAQMLLQEDMVSRLDQEAQGKILVCDAYFAGTASGAELSDYLKRHGRAHGYAAISPEPPSRFSTLRLSLSLDINRRQKNIEASYQLVSTPYRLIYDPYDHWAEPESVPFLSGQRIYGKQVSYSLWGIQAVGTLTAGLYDASGKLLYSRTFPNLAYVFDHRARTSLPTMDLLDAVSVAYGQLQAHDRPTYEFSGNLWPLPTTFGIVRRVTLPCLQEVIRDIIPNRQRMTLQVNEGGDQQMLMLIRGGAYREALAYADSLKDHQHVRLSCADWENMGAASECLGKLPQARFCYENALKLQPGSFLATEALKRLGH